MSDTALAPLEHDRLSACEETIESGLKTFTDVGNALLVIRDERLYRAKYGTFEDYCQKRWNMERRHAYRLIDSAEVVRNVSNWTQTTPDSESVARPLTGLSPDVQREVWQEAVDTAPNGKVTAKHVQEVVDRHTEVVDGDTGEVIENPRITKSTTTATRKPIHTETHEVSDAFTFVEIAISQLSRIRDDDPNRSVALQSVADWIESHI